MIKIGTFSPAGRKGSGKVTKSPGTSERRTGREQELKRKGCVV
jgi:hypothetical protein